ncbi:helix-turn-helix domain-containing protein [Vibrio parahaemolyticus]|nr:helix-turn-helix domain-containing protein [Vibrio parahaemolyticus]
MTSVAERIKKKRKLLGYTQAELAVLVNVKPQAVSGWERSINLPKGEQLHALSEALGVTNRWLLYGEELDFSDKNELVTMVPFYEDILAAAGNGFENQESEVKSFYPLPKEVLIKESNKSSVFCIKAYGDSMSPVLRDGAVLAVNRAKKDIVDGRIYVFHMRGHLRVKLIKNTHKGLIMESYNKDYLDELIPWDELEHNNIGVVGEVIWYSSKINC